MPKQSATEPSPRIARWGTRPLLHAAAAPFARALAPSPRDRAALTMAGATAPQRAHRRCHSARGVDNDHADGRVELTEAAQYPVLALVVALEIPMSRRNAMPSVACQPLVADAGQVLSTGPTGSWPDPHHTQPFWRTRHQTICSSTTPPCRSTAPAAMSAGTTHTASPSQASPGPETVATNALCIPPSSPL